MAAETVGTFVETTLGLVGSFCYALFAEAVWIGVGGAVGFDVIPHPPKQPQADRIGHDSLRLTWEPPPQEFVEDVSEYLVKIYPQFGEYEETTEHSTRFKTAQLWNHHQQSIKYVIVRACHR